MKKINEVDKKILAELLRKKERTHKLIVLVMKEETSLKILRTLKEIRDYFEQFYANRFDNLDAMEKIAQML